LFEVWTNDKPLICK